MVVGRRQRGTEENHDETVPRMRSAAVCVVETRQAHREFMSPFWPELRRRPPPRITAGRPPADVLHCMSLRAMTMPGHSQGVITRGNVGDIVPAVPI
jgi:hypothetical protein